MRSPSQAIADILQRVPAPEQGQAPESVALRHACGRILARAVLSDVDLPPFEKSAMDGFALAASSAASLPSELPVVGESRAGGGFPGVLPAGACVSIYTGAPMPEGADSVVMVEHVRCFERAGQAWVALERPLRLAQNVNHRAEVLAKGRQVFAPGRRLAPVDLSVLAAVGCDPVPVVRRPRAAILTTGDELVPANQRPGPGQIREGNTLFLAAALERLGAEVVELALLRDDPELLAAAFEHALANCDLLVTTGGVSVGKYDLVGAALERVGVEPVLHKIAVKPGKPIWFGLRGRVPVFGLPGNPVSSLLGFEVFVRPALARLCGAEAAESVERLGQALWRGPSVAPDERQNNLPARLQSGAAGVLELVPLAYKGSADLLALCSADAFAVAPAGEGLQAGQLIAYRPLR